MYTRILVPLDGSELAERALGHARNLAQSNGAALHLVRVFTQIPNAGTIPTGSGTQADRSAAATVELARQLQDAQIAGAEVYLDDIAAQLKRDGIRAHSELLQGPADERIVDYARRHGIDLIVMCTHGRGGIRRMLVGSVTDKVVRAGEVPVLVVPS